MSTFYLQGNHWEIQMSARSKWLRTFVITSELQFLLVLKWFCGNKYCNLLNIDLISQSIFQMVKTLVKIKMIAKRWVFIQSNFLCKNFDGCERPLAVVRACGGTHLPPRPEVRPCNSNHFPLIFPLGFNAPTFIYIPDHLSCLYSSPEGAPWQLTLQAGLFKIRLVGSSPEL